jgi:DNA topoisomerase VI subunit A
LSHQNEELAVPKIEWLGLKISQFLKYEIPSKCMLELSDRDLNKANELLKRNAKDWK